MAGPRTLTARLVVTSVVLVAIVVALIAVVTTFATRSFLTGQLDDDVRGSVDRASHAAPGPDLPVDPPGEPGPDVRGQGVGTVTAFFSDAGDGRGDVIVGARGLPDRQQLGQAALDALRDVPRDGEVHEVDLPGLGEYRVQASSGDTWVVSGLPTDDVEDAIASLVRWELLLGLLGVLAAALAGTVVVRRQLRPLRDVAATAHSVATLPLASGDIALDERVPERLTDERTEVGQVGSALNTLLSHVEAALSARQRSEAQARQFVADASHELRTPLATVQGYAELARTRPDDTEGMRAALAKVESASHRMTDLVEDLLLLARLDSGRPLERRPVDLTRLVLEAVADARMLAPDHRWRLDLPDEPLAVTGDEQRLHQVVTNLLTNARRHTPPGTAVTVSARPGEVCVHDDGPGFPPGLVDTAFERFTRGDDARSRSGEPGGAGLGLSLVQAVVEAHGGEVALDSRPGDTTVTVRLPA